MAINQAKFDEGIRLAIPKIKEHEGFKENAYKDVAGVVTIGYGFTAAVIPGLKMGDKITREKADLLLASKVKTQYAAPVAKAIKVWDDPGFTGQMFSALITMAWQIGPGLAKHDIIKRINEKNYAAAADLITQKSYTTAGGKVYKGLVNRREAEATVFRKGMVAVAAGGGGLLLVLGGLALWWYLKKKGAGSVSTPALAPA